jgi:uncharacterized membrane protein
MKEMDWYSLVKFLHVASAVVWVGGGFALALLALRGERANNIEAMLVAMRATGELGNRLFAPMSMLTFAFGFILCWFWVGFSDLWIVIGLAGYLTTFTVGMTVFKPTADRMAGMIAAEGITPRVLELGQRMLRFARLDYSVMLVIVADMVLKPTAADVVVLGAMATVLAVGVAMALGVVGSRQLTPAPAA